MSTRCGLQNGPAVISVGIRGRRYGKSDRGNRIRGPGIGACKKASIIGNATQSVPFLFFSTRRPLTGSTLAFIEPGPNAQRMFTSALPSHSNLALLLHRLSVMFRSVLPSPSVRNGPSCV